MMQRADQFSIADIKRLLELVSAEARERGVSPSEVIDSLPQLSPPAADTRSRIDEFTAQFADKIRRIRLKRNAFIGAPVFREPAWDMLLDLFAAHQRGQQLTVSMLCHVSGVPLSTAARQLQRLESYGLLTREGDTADSRTCLVRPTPKALEAVAATVTQLIDSFLAMQQEFNKRG